MVEVSPDSLLSGTIASYGASAVARTSGRGRVTEVYVCVFITAGPMIKLCAGGEGDSEGHVL